MDVYKRASDLTVVEKVKIKLHDARFIHFGFAGLLALSIGVIFIVGFQFGSLETIGAAAQIKDSSTVLSARSLKLIDPTITPIPKSPSTADSDTVSYSSNFFLPLLKANGVIYIDENSPFNYIPDPTKLQWTVVATPSGDVIRDDFRKIYSFKRFTAAKDGTTHGFAFVMRWDFSHYDVFLYRTSTAQGSMAQRIGTFFSPLRDKGINIPKIDQVSEDGNYVALDMHPCSDCGGSDALGNTLLINVATGVKKRIGKTTYFNWKDNGAYEFKSYRELYCTNPIGGAGNCPPDTSVSLQTGQM